jgi:hypothetical protein
MNRRKYLTLMGAAAGALGLNAYTKLDALAARTQTPAQDSGAPTTSTVADRTRRMQWWHEAKRAVKPREGIYKSA